MFAPRHKLHTVAAVLFLDFLSGAAALAGSGTKPLDEFFTKTSKPAETTVTYSVADSLVNEMPGAISSLKLKELGLYFRPDRLCVCGRVFVCVWLLQA